MRCCASSTTSTAADQPSVIVTFREPQGDTKGPQPAQLAEALLFREILKPLAQALGPVGEIALGTVADDLFVRRAR